MFRSFIESHELELLILIKDYIQTFDKTTGLALADKLIDIGREDLSERLRSWQSGHNVPTDYSVSRRVVRLLPGKILVRRSGRWGEATTRDVVNNLDNIITAITDRDSQESPVWGHFWMLMTALEKDVNNVRSSQNLIRQINAFMTPENIEVISSGNVMALGNLFRYLDDKLEGENQTAIRRWYQQIIRMRYGI